ncbi:hypothetical protein ACQEVB_16170 [Pseudonocardia sp. CA-107938]|uniref:hypothetical protein n=1 Tax=Pseudonocardia sp. CA-107938 TaxID=3240021 RepID=UPI003D8FECCF
MTRSGKSLEAQVAQNVNDLADLYVLVGQVERGVRRVEGSVADLAADHGRRLDALAATQAEHSATLAEHSATLASHGSKLDEILELLRAR